MFLPNIPEFLIWLIYLAPLGSAGVISISIFARNSRFAALVPENKAGHIAIGFALLSWMLGLWTLDMSIGYHGEDIGLGEYLWLSIFDLQVSFGLGIDGLRAVFRVWP